MPERKAFMPEKEFAFDPKKAYLLINVKDGQGNSKADSSDLYRKRVGCIATGLSARPAAEQGKTVLYMQFSCTADGQPVCLPMKTSPIVEVRQGNGLLTVTTRGSVYYLRETQMPKTASPRQKNMIELYLRAEGSRFHSGFFHDEKGEPHALRCVCSGDRRDSCALVWEADGFEETACAYSPQENGVSFYGSGRGGSRRFLLHNLSDSPMEVRFSTHRSHFVLQPHDKRYFTV